nr:hypothetical protein [Thaumasiovibrio occultus]
MYDREGEWRLCLNPECWMYQAVHDIDKEHVIFDYFYQIHPGLEQLH